MAALFDFVVFGLRVAERVVAYGRSDAQFQEKLFCGTEGAQDHVGTHGINDTR